MRWLTRSLRARQVSRRVAVVVVVAGVSGTSGPQPGSVGAQGVGQHVGIEPVVLVARRSVAAAQVLQLVRADHDHRGGGRVEQSPDDPARRDVRWRPRARRGRANSPSRSRRPSALCSTVAPGRPPRPRLSTTATAWSSRAQSIPPVHTVRRVLGQGRDGLVTWMGTGRLHVSLLAASSSGELSFRAVPGRNGQFAH